MPDAEASLNDVVEYFKTRPKDTWLTEAQLAAALGKDVKQALLLGLSHLHRDPELLKLSGSHDTIYALNR